MKKLIVKTGTEKDFLIAAGRSRVWQITLEKKVHPEQGNLKVVRASASRLRLETTLV